MDINPLTEILGAADDVTLIGFLIWRIMRLDKELLELREYFRRRAEKDDDRPS